MSYFARRLSGDSAEDLAQGALIRVTRALPTIDPSRSDRFIATVAANLLRTAYAQRARALKRWAPEQDAEAAEAPSAPDREAEFRELALVVHRVSTLKLPPALQEVVLGLLREETPAEIAARLGISPVTVRTRLMRARAILRRELQLELDLPSREDG